MLNEADAVCCPAGFGPKPTLERCEWTTRTEPRLGDNYRDSNDVRDSEPEGIDPTPAADVASDDKNKTSNNEEDNREVQAEHGIREQLVGQVVAHVRCLDNMTPSLEG